MCVKDDSRRFRLKVPFTCVEKTKGRLPVARTREGHNRTNGCDNTEGVQCHGEGGYNDGTDRSVEGLSRIVRTHRTRCVLRSHIQSDSQLSSIQLLKKE